MTKKLIYLLILILICISVYAEEQIDYNANTKTSSTNNMSIVSNYINKCNLLENGNRQCEIVMEFYNPLNISYSFTGTKVTATFIKDVDNAVYTVSKNYDTVQSFWWNQTCINETTPLEWNETYYETLQNLSIDFPEECKVYYFRREYYNYSTLDLINFKNFNYSFAIKMEFTNTQNIQNNETFTDRINAFNLTLKTTAFTLTHDPDITGCTQINTSGTYTMQNDISVITPYCINITGNNVMFEMAGHTLASRGTNGTDCIRVYRAVLGNANVTITNGTISDCPSYAIRLYNARKVTLKNLRINVSDRAVYNYRSDNMSIWDTYISGGKAATTADLNLYMQETRFANISNVTLMDSGYGIQFLNIYQDNSFRNVYMNTSRLADVIYTATSATYCKAMEFANVTNMYTNKYYYYVNKTGEYDGWQNASGFFGCNFRHGIIKNIVFYTNGSTTNTGSANFISMSYNVTLQNNTFTNFYYANYYYYIDNVTIKDNTFYNGTYANMISTATHTARLFNNSFTNTGYAIYKSTVRPIDIFDNIFNLSGQYIFYAATGINFYNVSFYNNYCNSTLANSIYVTVAGNYSINVSKKIGTRKYTNGTFIGGNYWINPSGTGFSEHCVDSNKDGFCDLAYNFKPTTTVNITDYYPYSTNYTPMYPFFSNMSTNSTYKNTNITFRVMVYDLFNLTSAIFSWWDIAREKTNGTGDLEAGVQATQSAAACSAGIADACTTLSQAECKKCTSAGCIWGASCVGVKNCALILNSINCTSCSICNSWADSEANKTAFTYQDVFNRTNVNMFNTTVRNVQVTVNTLTYDNAGSTSFGMANKNPDILLELRNGTGANDWYICGEYGFTAAGIRQIICNASSVLFNWGQGINETRDVRLTPIYFSANSTAYLDTIIFDLISVNVTNELEYVNDTKIDFDDIMCEVPRKTCWFNITKTTPNILNQVVRWKVFALNENSLWNVSDMSSIVLTDASGDITPPLVIPYLPLNNSVFTTNSINFSVWAEDNQLTFSSHVLYKNNNTKFTNELIALNNTKANVTATVDDGVGYNFTFNVTDLVNNVYADVVNITIAKNYPTVTFQTPTTLPDAKLSQTFINANISYTGLILHEAVIYLWDSTGILQSQVATSNPYFYNFTGLTNGVYYINASVNDTLERKNWTATRTITLDTIAPTITIITPEEKTYFDSAMMLNVTTDEFAVSCKYTLNGTTNMTMTPVMPASTNFWADIVLGDGNQNISYYCDDLAGNMGGSGIRYFEVDTAPPTVSLMYPLQSDIIINEQVNFTFLAVNSVGGEFDRCELWGNWKGTIGDSGWHLNRTITSISNNTKTNISVDVYDGTGYKWDIFCNETDASSTWSLQGNQTFAVDRTAPVMAYENPTLPNNGYYRYNLSINVSINESVGLSKLQYVFDSTNYTIFDESLQIYYGMDENLKSPNNNTDISKYGRNGTYYNPYTTGKVGKGLAMRYDTNNNDYISISNLLYSSLGEISDISIAMWVNTPVTLYKQTLLSFDDTNYYEIYIDEVGKLNWVTTDEDSVTDTMQGNGTFLGNWHHLVVTYNSTNAEKKIYLDGAVDYITYLTVGNKLGTGLTRYGFIGTGSQAETYDGQKDFSKKLLATIDELKIYNTILTDSDILGIYKNESVNNYSNIYPTNVVLNYRMNDTTQVMDDVAGNNDGYLHIVGMPYLDYNARYGQSMRFEKSGINLTESIINQMKSNRTIEMWFNATNATSTQKQVIYEEGDILRGMDMWVENGNLFAGAWDTPVPEGALNSVLSYPINSNQWYYVALTLNGSTKQENAGLKLYINGTLVMMGNGSRIYPSLGDIKIGMAGTTKYNTTFSSGEGDYFAGLIDEVKIWNITFTANDIAQHYRSSINKYSASQYMFFANETGIIGNHTAIICTTDVHGNEGCTQQRTFNETYYYAPTINWTNISITNHSIRGTVNGTNFINITYSINKSDNTATICSGANTSGQAFSLLCNGLDNYANYQIYIKATNGDYLFSNITTLTVNFRTLDLNPPTCYVLSRTPSKINDSSQGQFSVIMNCTDQTGINTTKVGNDYYAFVTRTLEGLVTVGLPNRWSIRPPANNISQVDTLLSSYGQIMRAFGRSEGLWYDTLNTINNVGDANLTSWFLADNYSYAGGDGHYGYLNLTIESPTSVILNYTMPSVRVMAFRQNIPLSYESLILEEKKNVTISKNLQLLVYRNDLEAMKNSSNYTITVFRNIGTTATAPTAVLRAFYCNSSYSPTGGVSVLTSTNCVAINAITPASLTTIVLSEKNSSYSQGFYSVIDKKIGGITATPYHYYYYDTLESNSNRAFEYRYANGTTNSNVSFADTSRTWTSTNKGATWTQLKGTLDLMEFTIKNNNDEFQFGYCIYDLSGNLGCNRTVFVDDITLTNHPISTPFIREYNSSINVNNTNLSGTFKGMMNILIGVAKDPDSIGNVTHNLTLRNIDGTFNYTINGSFKSPDDSPIWINFDTTLVQDGLYLMDISAQSGDNPLDIKNLTTVNNFTINNLPCADITNFAIQSNTTDSLYLNWTKPTCTDFQNYIIYKNDVFLTALFGIANESYNSTGLINFTMYNHSIVTNDTFGNLGKWINITNRTGFNATPPNVTAPVASNIKNVSGNGRANDTIYITFDTDRPSNFTINWEYGDVKSNFTNATWQTSMNFTLLSTNTTTGKWNFTIFNTTEGITNFTFYGNYPFTTGNNPDLTPCPDVTNVNNVSNTTTSLLFNWTKVTCDDFNQYLIYKNDVYLTALFGIANESYNSTDLLNYTYYNHSIRTNDTNGNLGNLINITGLTGFNATYINATAPVISNLKNTSCNGRANDTFCITFDVDRSTNATILHNYGNISQTAYNKSFNFTITVSNLTLVKYNITVFNNTEAIINYTISSNYEFTTGANPDLTPPNSISNLQCNATGASTAICTWSNSSSLDISGFTLYLSGTYNSNQSELSKTLSSLSASTNYSFGVEAYDTSANKADIINITFITQSAPVTPSGGGGGSSGSYYPSYQVKITKITNTSVNAGDRITIKFQMEDTNNASNLYLNQTKVKTIIYCKDIENAFTMVNVVEVDDKTGEYMIKATIPQDSVPVGQDISTCNIKMQIDSQDNTELATETIDNIAINKETWYKRIYRNITQTIIGWLDKLKSYFIK